MMRSSFCSQSVKFSRECNIYNNNNNNEMFEYKLDNKDKRKKNLFIKIIFDYFN